MHFDVTRAVHGDYSIEHGLYLKRLKSTQPVVTATGTCLTIDAHAQTLTGSEVRELAQHLEHWADTGQFIKEETRGEHSS
jgi:hypothetical protein